MRDRGCGLGRHGAYSRAGESTTISSARADPAQGKIDAAAEVDKLEKKAAIVQGSREKLQKVADNSGIKEEVKVQNAEKVRVADLKISVSRYPRPCPLLHSAPCRLGFFVTSAGLHRGGAC